MSLTTAIALNAVLFVLIVGFLLWLLAHPGIAKSRHHEIRLLRLHSRRR
jgi:uncharacterized membrane protein